MRVYTVLIIIIICYHHYHHHDYCYLCFYSCHYASFEVHLINPDLINPGCYFFTRSHLRDYYQEMMLSANTPVQCITKPLCGETHKSSTILIWYSLTKTDCITQLMKTGKTQNGCSPLQESQEIAYKMSTEVAVVVGFV